METPSFEIYAAKDIAVGEELLRFTITFISSGAHALMTITRFFMLTLNKQHNFINTCLML